MYLIKNKLQGISGILVYLYTYYITVKCTYIGFNDLRNIGSRI